MYEGGGGGGGGGWTPVMRKRGKGGLQRASMASGFFNCPVPAEVVVQKTNGIWCEDKRLKVRMAEFNRIVPKKNGKDEEVNMTMQRNHLGLKLSLALAKEKCPMQSKKKGRGQKSYAEVVSGREEQGTDAITVIVKEEANEWLYDSVIVKLKTFFSFHDFKEEVSRRGMKEVLVREGGERLAVLTFSSELALKEGTRSLKQWVYQWCDSVLEWRRGVVVTKCMENINKVIYLRYNESLVPVRVCEAMKIPLHHLKCSSMSRDTKEGTIEEVDQISINGAHRRGGGTGKKVEEMGSMHGMDDIVVTKGFLRSVSGLDKDRPSINLERKYDQKSKGVLSRKRKVGSRWQRTTGVKKYTQKKMNQRGMLRSSYFSRGAICRATTIATLLSLPQMSGPSRRDMLLKEARDTVQLGKLLGMNCKGKDEEVVNRTVEIEIHDKEKMGGGLRVAPFETVGKIKGGKL
ncbi:hypothetical protein ACSBR2_029847 [Camellia fascicularis]